MQTLVNTHAMRRGVSLAADRREMQLARWLRPAGLPCENSRSVLHTVLRDFGRTNWPRRDSALV